MVIKALTLLLSFAALGLAYADNPLYQRNISGDLYERDLDEALYIRDADADAYYDDDDDDDFALLARDELYERAIQSILSKRSGSCTCGRPFPQIGKPRTSRSTDFNCDCGARYELTEGMGGKEEWHQTSAAQAAGKYGGVHGGTGASPYGVKSSKKH